MKMLILLAVMISLSGGAIGQEQRPVSATPTKADYLKKSQNQKAVGWVLLGTGTGLMIVGVALLSSGSSNILGNNSSNFETGSGLFSAGILADLVSLPFFIGSGNNARKAASISLGDQHVLWPRQTGFAWQHQPSIKLTWPLGRK